jgi:hypothetical protein
MDVVDDAVMEAYRLEEDDVDDGGPGRAPCW